MLCCVGLIGGMAVGQSLGGPWTYIAPAAGFGIGLVADMKFMHGMHKKGDEQNTVDRPKKSANPARRMVEDDGEAQQPIQRMSQG